MIIITALILIRTNNRITQDDALGAYSCRRIMCCGGPVYYPIELSAVLRNVFHYAIDLAITCNIK